MREARDGWIFSWVFLFESAGFGVVVAGQLDQALFGVLSHGLVGLDALDSGQANALNKSFSVLKNRASKVLVAMLALAVTIFFNKPHVGRTANAAIVPGICAVRLGAGRFPA
jgi:hypothetical protein